MRGSYRWPVNSPQIGLLARKMFPFDDAIMKQASKVTIYHQNLLKESCGIFHWRRSWVFCSGHWVNLVVTAVLNVNKTRLYQATAIHNPFSILLRVGFSQLPHWGRDKMAIIFQTTFSNAFSWMKMNQFRLRFHWNLFPRVKLTISHHCFI